jgi:hypothetical protein
MHRFIRTLLFGFFLVCFSAIAFAQVGVSITIAPPALPIYEQPVCPGDGYMWTPGYWGWGDDFNDYYWVPGTWVLAPEPGFLWTPPYWGWGGSGFVFYNGYWGPHIGFYGGINYGFGYFGVGFEGGRWEGDHFFYNRAVVNVNVTDIHNVYETRITNTNVTHVSYNGGNGGITARPTPEEEAAAHDRHAGPVPAQTQHVQEARSNTQLRASANQGRPPIAATAKPGEFSGSGVVRASDAGGHYTPAADRGENGARPGSTPATHVRDLPPSQRPAAPNTGNAKLDAKYQKQQNKQYAKQQKERDKLQMQQDKEDARVTKQNNAAAKQQVEQRHQQQTQQMQQRHQQQTQQMQQRMAPAPRSDSHPR